MICRHCKLQINEDDDICPYCGKPTRVHLESSEEKSEPKQRSSSVPIQKYFFKAFIDMYRRYFHFGGTTGRGEFWSVQLILLLILFPFASIYGRVEPESVILTGPQVWIVSLTALFVLVSVIPLFALSVRRLHDANLPGWLILIQFIPGFGSLIVFILLLFEHKDNKYTY